MRTPCTSIRRSILVCVLPFPVIPQCGLQVVVRVSRGIASAAVAHFEIKNVGVGPVHELMCVPRAGFEARAHARRKRCLALVRDEHRVSLQDVHKFVLFRVGVTKGRARSWIEARQVHPEVRQAEDVTQRPLFPARLRYANGSG